MKISTYLLLAAAIVAAAPAQAAPEKASGKTTKVFKFGNKKTASSKEKYGEKVMNQIRKAEYEVKEFRARQEKVFAWDGSDWMLDTSYSLKYDKIGRLIEEVGLDYEGFYLRTSYTYDENDMVIEEVEELSEDGEYYENVSKKIRTYDPIITNLITSNREYYWNGEEWELNGNNYNRTITRNADGNVSNVEIAVWYDGAFDPTIRINMEYGEDGKATAINESVLDYDGNEFFWVDGMSITNITWEDFNGQIVEADAYTSGANRMKSFDQAEDDDTMHAEITYDGNNFTAIVTGMDDGAELEGTSSFEVLDEYGGYKQVTDYTYTYDEEESYNEVETYIERYDAFGLLLESKNFVSYDGFEEVYEDLAGTVEYDWAWGVPLTYTIETTYFDYSTEEYVTEYMMKIEYSDYIGIVSGVDDLNAASDNEVSFYTLQGVKVANPAPGNVYIKKEGSKVSKVIL